MFKRLILAMVILAAALAFSHSPASAQTKEDGTKLYEEASALEKKAQSEGDLKMAVTKCEEALRIFQKVQFDKGIDDALNKLGGIYYALSQYSKAQEYYEKSLEIKRKIGDVRGEGRTLNNLGEVYRAWAQYPKAVEYYEKSLEFSRKTGDTRMEGRTLNNLGLVHRAWAQYPKAVEYYEKSLEFSRKTGDTHMEGGTLNNLGEVYRVWAQYPKALEYYEKSLEIKRKIGDVRGEGASLNNLGLVHQAWAQYAKAVEYFEKSLGFSRKTGDTRMEGRTLNNLGEVYRAWAQYAKAVEYYEKSLELSRKTSDLSMEGGTLNNLGLVYQAWGQHAKAVGFYEKSLEIKRKIGDVRGQANTLNNLGLVYQAWGQHAKAVECHEKSLEIARKIGDVKLEAQDLDSLGAIYANQGQYAEASTNFRKGLEIYERIGVPTKRSKNLIANVYLDTRDFGRAEPLVKEAGYDQTRGRFCLLQSNYQEARGYYENLLKRAEKSRDASLLFTGYTGLGMAYEGLEDDKKAEEYYEKGMKFTEELRSMAPPAERKEFFQVKINGFSRSEPAKGLTRVRMKTNRSADSIDSSEQTRARAFSDAIAQLSQNGVSGVPESTLKKEEELVTRLALLKKERSQVERDKDPEKYDNITREADKVESELNKFIAMLREKYVSYAAVKYPQPVTLKQSSVRPNEHVVMFDVSSAGVGVKLIKGKEIVETAYKRWKLEDLERDIRRFREPFEQVAVKKGAALKKFDPELGESLYKNLLMRVLVDVPKGTPLVIIPDGVLAVLPFEALVVGGKANWKDGAKGAYPEGLTYLGDVYPISYYQSINSLTLVRAAKGKEKTGKRVLIVADPVFRMADERAQGAKETRLASGQNKQFLGLMAAIEEASTGSFEFSRLAGTRALGEGLRKLYGNDVELCADLDANKEHFLNTIAPRLSQYGSIVFATHGLFSTKIPGIREPFLALTMVPPGTDGYLTMSDVMSLKMTAELVTLTACQTGLGKELSGEGVMSMGRAFQCAGARSVLMSLWSVAEDSSVILTESFFRNFKEGKSKLVALRLAREEVRKAGYDHPFFWTPFILVGETD